MDLDIPDNLIMNYFPADADIPEDTVRYTEDELSVQ